MTASSSTRRNSGAGRRARSGTSSPACRRCSRACVSLLSDSPLFLILTAYSIRASFLSIHELSAECLAERGGVLESGELVIREEGGGRGLSTSLFSRWSPDG